MTSTNRFAEEPPARYFHATLYKFTATAVAAVVDALNTNVGNIEAHCGYSAKKDVSLIPLRPTSLKSPKKEPH